MPTDMGAHFGVHIDLETGGFDTYSGHIDKVDARTGALVATNKRATSSFMSMMGGMLAAQASMALLTKGFNAVMTTIHETADAYRTFENSMTEVSTILSNQSMELLPQLQTGVESLSVTFGKGANDIARGLYDILSAAVPAEDALQLLYTSTKSAVAGLADVSTSVDVMTSVLNAYGKTVEQMVHVSDVMFQSIIRGKFRYEDLANALGYVTPIAAQVGVSFEELAAAMATATRHGQHIDMVSRGLALAMQNIIKPGAQAAQIAAEYGVELSLASLRAKGLVGFLEELNVKTNGNAAVISQIIPNMRSYRVAMVLAGEGIEGVKEDITLMSESLGQADKAFGKMANTSQMATNIIQQSFEDVNRTIGESTIETDLAIKKLGVFKNLFIGQWMETVKTPGIESLVPGYSFIEAAIGAGGQSQRVFEQVGNYIDKYTNEWKQQFAEVVDEDADTTLFQKMLGGDEVDLKQYENAAQEYLDAADAYVDRRAAFEKAKTTGMLNQEQILSISMSLQQEQSAIFDLYDAYAYWKSGIDDAESAIESHSESIDIYTQKLSVLSKEIGEVGVMYDGTLGQALKVAEKEKMVGDMSHYISLALQEEQYQTEMVAQNFSWYSDELGDAISVIRAYENQQKSATAATKEFNFALAENKIQMMELQLIGMMRRRGLTRTEQKRMQKLRIERTKIQIEQAKKELESQKNANTEMVSDTDMAYREAKDIVEGFQRENEHQLWLLKEEGDTSVQDLQAQISTKEQAYLDLSKTVIQTHKDMGKAIQIYGALVNSYYGKQIPEDVQNSIDQFEQWHSDYGKDTAEVTGGQYVPSNIGAGGTVMPSDTPDTLMNVLRQRWFQAGLPDYMGFARGIRYAPHDMVANIHRGETIVPNGVSNKGGSGGTQINAVHIHVNSVEDINSVEKVAAVLSEASDNKVISRGTARARNKKTGNTYRVI